MISGAAGKKSGMAAVKRHADPHWWRCMMECARMVAEQKQYFYSEDIKALCRKLHPNATTHDMRAVGPLMTAIAKLGYSVKTNDHVDAVEPQSHQNPKRVWWSLIYKGPKPRKRPKMRKPLDPRQLSFEMEAA